MGIIDKTKKAISAAKDKAVVNVEKFMLSSFKNSIINGAIFHQISTAEKKTIKDSDIIKATLLLKIDLANRKTVNSLSYVLAAKPKTVNLLSGESPLTEEQIASNMKQAKAIAKMAQKDTDEISAFFINCDLIMEEASGTYKRPKNLGLNFLLIDKQNKKSKFII